MPNPVTATKKYAFKLCVLGEGSVGKTTLVERLTTGKFNAMTKMTIGIDFSMVNLDVAINSQKNVNIDLQVWDLGGQDRFRFILPAYIQGADGGLLLYDVNWFMSEKNLSDWMELWFKSTLPDIPLYLIGTKLDLVNRSKLQLVQQRIVDLKTELGIKQGFLISSKDGTMLHQMIHSIARDMWLYKNQYNSIKKEYSLFDRLHKS